MLKVITMVHACGFEKYRTYHGRTPCPYEIDCGGVIGTYVRVRLPGSGRALALRSVDVFRAEPKGVPLSTSAEDPQRGYACYGTEAQLTHEATTETFLEEVKLLDYTISTDPRDPIFYSTCFHFEIVTNWLPIFDLSVDVDNAVHRQFNFSGHCLSCESYFQNYLNRTDPSLNGYISPQWYWQSSGDCEDCDAKYGFTDPSISPTITPFPSEEPVPSPAPSTPAPTQEFRTHAIDWALDAAGALRGGLSVRIGDTLAFNTDLDAHNVVKLGSEAAFRYCDFSSLAASDDLSLGATASPVLFEIPSVDAQQYYYFACSVGSHCSIHDQKLAVSVTNWYASSPAPTPSPTIAPTTLSTISVAVAVSVAASACPTAADEVRGFGSIRFFFSRYLTRTTALIASKINRFRPRS